MSQEVEITQAELAHLAGVGSSVSNRAVHSVLRADRTPDGRRVYRDRVAVQAWIQRCRRKRQPPPPDPREQDPFAFALGAVTRAPVPVSLEPVPQLKPQLVGVDAVLENLRVESGGKLPPIEDFRHEPFDVVLVKYGTLEALVSAVKASKLYGDMRAREIEAAQKRGDLIARRTVTAVLAPLVNLAFSRLVGEAPAALRDQVVARVNSGGSDLAIDVETLIRDEVSGILTDCKLSLGKELERFED